MRANKTSKTKVTKAIPIPVQHQLRPSKPFLSEELASLPNRSGGQHFQPRHHQKHKA